MSIIKTEAQERMDKRLDKFFGFLRFILVLCGLYFIVGLSLGFVHLKEKVVYVYENCHIEEQSNVSDLMGGKDVCELYDCTSGK